MRYWIRVKKLSWRISELRIKSVIEFIELIRRIVRTRWFARFIKYTVVTGRLIGLIISIIIVIIEWFVKFIIRRVIVVIEWLIKPINIRIIIKLIITALIELIIISKFITTSRGIEFRWICSD